MDSADLRNARWLARFMQVAVAPDRPIRRQAESLAGSSHGRSGEAFGILHGVPGIGPALAVGGASILGAKSAAMLGHSPAARIAMDHGLEIIPISAYRHSPYRHSPYRHSVASPRTY